MMIVKPPKFKAAIALVETMVAMAVLTIAAVSALSYQYHAAGQSRIAQAQTTATRTAQLLLEDWRNTGGSEDYDPNALDLGFSSFLTLPSGQGLSIPDGVYAITIDNVAMLIILTSNDVTYDPDIGMTLRQLTVNIKWGLVDLEDINLGEIVSGKIDSMRALVVLTTYIRLDLSSG
jgi:type II secretory pathway pseudopilin PulG